MDGTDYLGETYPIVHGGLILMDFRQSAAAASQPLRPFLK
jgi:hypothetical protein